MEKLKFALFSIVTLTIVGILGYWAFSTIQSGSEYVSTEKIKKLENENAELKEEMQNFKNELVSLQSEKLLEKQLEQKEEIKQAVETKPPASSKTYKYQEQINELQKLIDSSAVVKLKSNGARVGTIQKFLNIYNKTSNKIDNDFGEGMKKEVIAFQKDQGLSGDGEAGKTTFTKMIDWLKKQG